MKQSFFVFGNYGEKNTGDDAMLYVLLQELHYVFPKAVFAVAINMPAKVPSMLKNKTNFVKLKSIPALAAVLKSSCIVLGGGTHIHDFLGNIRYLKNLMIIFFLFRVCKILGKGVYLLGVGIGPVSTIWGKFLSKQICRTADFINVRDKTSYEIVKGFGIKGKITLSFDLAVLLNFSSYSELMIKRQDKNKILGISILPFFEIYCKKKGKDLLLIQKIAIGVNQWLKVNSSGIVHLFIFRGRSKDDDVHSTNLLKEHLCPVRRVKLISYNSDPRKTLFQISQCHAFVGMRLHSSIFAYLNDIPLLMINYHPKCLAFAKEIRLPDTAIISIEKILNGEFEEYFKNLLVSPNNFLAELPVNMAKINTQNVIRCGLNRIF